MPSPSLLPTHSAPALIEHLIDKLQRADDYADELEEDLDDDDLDEDRDPRDYALLALHAAFDHPPPPGAGEVSHAAASPLHETEGAPSSPSSPTSSPPSAQCPMPSASSFDGSPVPPDPLAFLALFDEAALDDFTNFTSHSRHIEDDEPRLYTERVILQHPDGRDIYRRFTFQRADDQSPWRLTLVEPYDPEDIDPSDGYLDQDEDFDDEPADAPADTS